MFSLPATADRVAIIARRYRINRACGLRHKPFLDRYLRQMLDVRVIQLDSLIEKVGQ
jgi:hypothetical protein